MKPRWRISESNDFDLTIHDSAHGRTIFIAAVLRDPADKGDALGELVMAANAAHHLLRDLRGLLQKGHSPETYSAAVAEAERVVAAADPR